MRRRALQLDLSRSAHISNSLTLTTSASYKLTFANQKSTLNHIVEQFAESDKAVLSAPMYWIIDVAIDMGLDTNAILSGSEEWTN